MRRGCMISLLVPADVILVARCEDVTPPRSHTLTPEKPHDVLTPTNLDNPSLASRHDQTAVFPVDTSSDAPPPASLSSASQAWVGKSLGKYRVTGVLGQGGMGVVLKAHDPTIERDVAIKVLADHLAADAAALGRFLAEAKVAGKLNHPNVTAIYEMCQEGQTSYLVLEYVPGGNLDDRLSRHAALGVLDATL